jgi:hypothetical protein
MLQRRWTLMVGCQYSNQAAITQCMQLANPACTLCLYAVAPASTLVDASVDRSAVPQVAAREVVNVAAAVAAEWDAIPAAAPARAPSAFALKAAATVLPESMPDRETKFMWPEGLHLTFDNTSGDAKNTATFKFLGALVGIGVFLYITVSTLLVGHTHDIVDQMFRVFAGNLRGANAETLNKMHKLFTDKYESKIYELSRLMASVKKAEGAVDADLDAPEISDRCRELAREFGCSPVVVRQTFAISSQNWCHETNKSIDHISRPHVFYIVKEEVPLDMAHDVRTAIACPAM